MTCDWLAVAVRDSERVREQLTVSDSVVENASVREGERVCEDEGVLVTVPEGVSTTDRVLGVGVR